MYYLKTLSPVIVNVSVSAGGIPKFSMDEAAVTFSGLAGDGHHHAKHCSPMQAVCLQDEELLQEVTREGITLDHGTIGENLTVRGLDVQNLPLGARLEIEGGVILELTKVRKPCYVLDAIDLRLKDWIVGRCGMYAKVISEGVIKKNASIKVVH